MSIYLNPVTASVTLANRQVHPVHLELTQVYGEHHHFEMTLDYDIYGDDFMSNPLKHIELIGRLVNIRFNQKEASNSESYLFKGVVTGIRQTGREGKKGYLVVTGSSPTIMLEKGKRMDIYSNKSLFLITKQVCERAYSDYITFGSEPVFKNKIDFLMQYNESDWDFLKRLAYLYRENLYYSGHELLFGYYPDLKTIDLTYDQEIIDLEFCSQMIPNNLERYQYVAESDSTIEREAPRTIENSNEYLDSAEEMAYNAMNTQEHAKTYTDTPVYSNSEVADILKRDKSRNATQSITLKGKSKTFKTTIGQVISIHMPEMLSKTGNIGAYRVVKSVHRIDEMNRYSCEFEGVPAEIEVMPIAEPKTISAESVVATVKSNEDPLNLGRVQVDFGFASNYNRAWVRVLTPNAGSSETIPQNRGLVFIPEKGDQVMIGFEHGDPNRPYVLGSLFHGKNSKGGGANNAEKSIITKSGIKIVFNDDQKSLHIQDPSGNTWDMDGNGNINIFAPKDITLKASNDINIESGNNLSFSVGNNLLTRVSNLISTKSLNLKNTITNYIQMFSASSIFSSKETMQIQSDDITALGKSNLLLHSESSIIANSKGMMDLKSTGALNLAQDTKDTTAEPESDISLATIEFRPLSTYDGEFGFDWLRIGDAGDAKFENTITDAIQSVTGTTITPFGNATDAFEELKRKEYNDTITITRSTTPAHFTEDVYYIPRLHLYTLKTHNSVTSLPEIDRPPYEAELRILATVESKKIKEFKFEYDKNTFELDLVDDKLPQLDVTDKIDHGTVKIKCKLNTDGFNHDKEIKVWAYPEDGSPEEIAGKLIIGKNNRTYRNTAKVLMIPVKTDIQGLGWTQRSPTNRDKEYLRKSFYQALCSCQIQDYTGVDFDLSTDLKFQKRTNTSVSPPSVAYGEFIYHKGTDPLHGNNISQVTDGYLYEDKAGFFEYLANKFWNLGDNRTTYNGWGLVFCFDELPYDHNSSTTSSVSSYSGNRGQVQSIGIKNTVVFKIRPDTTLAHEMLHGYDLTHTFGLDNANPYKFTRYTTKNIMDSTDSRYELWKYQWKVLNPNL